MKKIIAIVMALVMMMAVAVPAFAAELTDAANNGDTLVVVDGTAGNIGDGTYTVTIPAVVNLTWGNDGSDEYQIDCQLLTGKRVKVEIAGVEALKSAAGNEIVFAAADTTTGLSASEVVTDEAHAFEITVDENAWNAVPYDVYEGSISFASSVVDA